MDGHTQVGYTEECALFRLRLVHVKNRREKLNQVKQIITFFVNFIYKYYYYDLSSECGYLKKKEMFAVEN